MKRVTRFTLLACLALSMLWAAMVHAQGRIARPGDPLEASRPASSRSSASAWTTSPRSRLPRKGSDRRSMARAARSATTCRRLAAPAPILETRAGTTDEEGNFRTLDESGETLMHLFSIPTHGCQPIIPDTATIIARRAAIPVFGAGLVEAIADETILSLADPDDRDGNGVSGRAAFIVDVATGARRVGRFGWKAQHATLSPLAPTPTAMRWGSPTTCFQRRSGSASWRTRCAGAMPAPSRRICASRDTGRRGIDNFESFMKFLAPIGRGPVGTLEQQGQKIFATVGCAACHVPELTTARNDRALFDRKRVPLFSDLLLHDIGTGDGIAQGAALPSEIRTPALWGLRHRRPLMHDGGAATVVDAIRRHSVEAWPARLRFEQLSEPDLQALLAFLRSL